MTNWSLSNVLEKREKVATALNTSHDTQSKLDIIVPAAEQNGKLSKSYRTIFYSLTNLRYQSK